MTTIYSLVKHLTHLNISPHTNIYTLHILCEYKEEESFHCNIYEILRDLRDHCNLVQAELELTWVPQNGTNETWTIEIIEKNSIFLKYHPGKVSKMVYYDFFRA